MTVTMPETTPIFGKVSVVLVKTLADPTAPTATEINAATSINVSCFLYNSVVGTVTTNKGEAPRKICTRNQFQQRGISSVEVGDLTYSHVPMLPLTDDANKAKAALLDGTRWFMITRTGKDGTTALAAGDVVDVWDVELLNQNRGTTGDGEFDEAAIVQPVIAKSDPIYDVELS